MARFIFKLPDIGEGTAEAEIVVWHVKAGDRVREDQRLVDIMTDKATVEITSPVTGTVVECHAKPGDMATVGAPLVAFDVADTAGGTEAVASPAVVTPPQTVTAPPAPPADTPPSSRILAAPAVRLRAADLGIALADIRGTGPAGRVTHGDLDDYLAGRHHRPASPRPVPRNGFEDVKLIGLRRRIADKMQEAKRRIPHFTYVEEIDMTELEDLRAHLNATAGRPKLTPLPFVMRAMVRAVADFPHINAHFDDEAGVVRRFRAVHIGVATQTPAGLMVPVVRHAEVLDLWQAAGEVVRLAAAARDAKALKDELTGSTITVTSLGALGGVTATPIINHPEVAIVGPNAIVERPVIRNGQIAIRKMMNLSSSFDHRVVDGADAAAFVRKIKALLEHPALLYID